MAYLVRRRNDPVLATESKQHLLAQHPEYRGALDSEADIPIHWREEQIQGIWTGLGVERYKKLLCRFYPVTNEFAALMRIPLSPPPSVHTGPNLRHLFDNSTNLAHIIPAICRESSELFRQIPFRGWVRTALGLDDQAFEAFIGFHEILRCHILEYHACHQDALAVLRARFEDLKEQSPFVHAAITCGLREDDGPTPLASFGFIIGPLRTVLYDDRLHLWEVLLCLEVLEIRHRRQYVENPTIDFKSDFTVNISLYPAVVNNKKPRELACQLTLQDMELFRGLSANSFIVKDDNFRSIDTVWLNRADEARVLVTLCRDYLVDLTTELIMLRNYNAATAILEGLRTFENLPSSVRSLCFLIERHDNYIKCRNEMLRNQPVIPFLRPLAKCYERNGVLALPSIFQHSAYELTPAKSERPSGRLRWLYPLVSRVGSRSRTLGQRAESQIRVIEGEQFF